MRMLKFGDRLGGECAARGSQLHNYTTPETIADASDNFDLLCILFDMKY